MSGEPSLLPIFLFGFERSGTTLLSMMVGAHPDLALPLTVTGLWYKYGGKLGKYNDLAGREDVQSLVIDLLEEERIRLWDEELTPEDIFAAGEIHSYPDVVAAFHQAYAEKKGKTHWANLDIATLDEMHRAVNWFPEAKFLHIVRDCRDVALSHETMPYGASNPLECAQNWERRLSANRKMGAMLGSDQYMVIRYEDLVLQPEETLGKVCGFLELEYSDKMLSYGSMVESKIPADRRWLWPDLDKAPQADRCNQWKSKMPAYKRIIIEGEAGGLLKQLGYETYKTIPKSITAYLMELWYFLGRGGRFKRLQRKIGLGRPSKLERQWNTLNEKPG